MDPMEPFLAHLDDIWKLALSKTGNTADADDLTQETFLATLTAIRRGKEIHHPKTWLANTMMHLWYEKLRKKYREPVLIQYESLPEPVEIFPFLTEEEQEVEILLRNRVASLTKLYRDVITMHYIGGLSVAEMAERLHVPTGTIKRRLHDGREKMKKEQKSMETRELENCTPMSTWLSWTGNYPGEELMNLASTHLMQQILATAYDKPLTLEEIAGKIGVPVYYLEDQIGEAVKIELMCKTNGDKYYTNAFLKDIDNIPTQWQATLQYVSDHLTPFADSVNRIETAVTKLSTGAPLNQRQRRKLQRFAFLEMLQQYMMTPFTVADVDLSIHESGKAWLLIGHRIPLGMEMPQEVDKLGGHRTSGDQQEKDIYRLHEFDTSLWDSPNRYLHHNWLFCMCDLIYAIYRHIDPLSMNIPSEMVEEIPTFTDFGIFTQTKEGLAVDLPVLTEQEFDALQEICKREAEILRPVIADSLVEFRDKNQPYIPAHLGEAVNYWNHPEALRYLIPAIYRTLYDRGLYLQDVAYSCPPAVFVLN